MTTRQREYYKGYRAGIVDTLLVQFAIVGVITMVYLALEVI